MTEFDRIADLEATVAELRKFERGYAKPHVWNFIAKTLREQYASYMGRHVNDSAGKRAVTDIALAFAKRFDGEDGFDPLKFLDQCSPDTDLYPFSELWEDDE